MRFTPRFWIGLKSKIQNPKSKIALLLITLVLAGCDFDPKPVVSIKSTPTRPPVPTATRPAERSGGILTARITAPATSLNPWLAAKDPNAQAITGLIFSGLTRLDNHLQPQPDLAESWDVSDDGTALTFHLRQGIRWHDGQPFTADDVIWSYNTLAQLPAGTPGVLHIQDTVVSVQAVDPLSYTVRLNLKRRYSPLLADLSVPVLPKHLLENTPLDKLTASPFNSSPVGTGPFSYEGTQPNGSVTLKAFAGYYGGQPSIDRVAFLVAPDDKVAEEAVKNGTLMLAQLPPAAAERLVGAEAGVKGGAYDENGYDFVAFNLRPTHVFSDTRLRKAWALAIDKPGMVFAATQGNGDPVWTDVPASSWAYNPSASKYGGNLDEARRLLTEAGWVDTNGDGVVEKGGKPLQVNLYVTSGHDTRLKAAESMAQQLKRVGFWVKVQSADFSTSILARISPNANPPFDFDAVMLGWTRLGADPDPFALFHSSQIPTRAAPDLLNFTGFSAPEYDSLSIEGRSTYDYARRKEIYARTQEIIADQLPYYFLWAQKFGVVAGPKLQGDIDFSSPMYLWNADRWWIK